MKLFLDQDVYAVTTRPLRSRGHDVVTAAETGHARSVDMLILETAASEARILVTRDRDYGELVFVRGAPTGVIYLRVLPSTIAPVHESLDSVLGRYSEAELRAAFVVIEPGRHRIRRYFPLG